MRIPHLNQQGVRHVLDHLAHFPRPDRAAANALRDWAAGRGVILDPDQVEVVTLHYQPGTQFPVDAVVTHRQSLTQALLANWQGESANNLAGALFHAPWAGEWPGPMHLVDQLRNPPFPSNASSYEVFNGLFRRTTPQVYDDSTRIDLPAEQLQTFIWNLDFRQRYKAMLDDYWSGHFDSYRSSARLNFIAACNRQAADGSLSNEAVRLAWQVAGLRKPAKSLQVRPLNIYGYVAADIIWFKSAKRRRTVLFIPGNSSPLHEFADHGQLQDWVAQQCKDTHKRAALMQHFSAADVPDGLSYSGLATAMEGVAVYPERNHLDANRPGFTTEGYWPAREYVNYRVETYSPLISGDLFDAFTRRQQRRSYRDAQQLITSDGEVTRARWLNYISSAINYLAPLALVVPALAPLFAIGGVAQFALGVDQALEGRSLEEKANGVGGAIFGLLNAAPLATDLVKASPRLFRYCRDGFVMPSDINGQLGYPLSPVVPPRLPAAEVVEFFHDPDSLAPLPGADPAVAAAVVRQPTYRPIPDSLQGQISGYLMELTYDVEMDAFLLRSDENEVNPTYYRAPEPGSGRDMVPIEAGRRTVSNSMREATLRALGVDLSLPLEIPAMPLENATPIPANILSIWIGDQVLSSSLLENIAHNTSRLADSRYTFKLYLSSANSQAYAENLRLLGEKAPGLRVLPLEQQPAFETFRQSPYYEQYQAALTGNGQGPAHYASAADVLRYRLLHAEGGLYMDIDDTLLAPGEYAEMRDGKGLGNPGEALDDVVLATPQDGILLFPPVCNEKMANGNIFNNSLMGSHPGNPTLDAISDEMLARFRQTPDFYDTLPAASIDPIAFDTYARQLSKISGPRLLTDVVTRRLPYLRLLREIVNANAMNQRGLRAFVDLPRYRAAMRALLPLDRIAKIGGNQSWVH
nr:DUF6543 domain-containing protein [Pseudomonas sp. Marseille-Q3773]